MLIERIITTPIGTEIQCFANNKDEMIDLIKGISFNIFTTEEFFNEIIICPEKFVLCSNGRKNIIRRTMPHDIVEDNQIIASSKEHQKIKD